MTEDKRVRQVEIWRRGGWQDRAGQAVTTSLRLRSMPGTVEFQARAEVAKDNGAPLPLSGVVRTSSASDVVAGMEARIEGRSYSIETVSPHGALMDLVIRAWDGR